MLHITAVVGVTMATVSVRTPQMAHFKLASLTQRKSHPSTAVFTKWRGEKKEAGCGNPGGCGRGPHTSHHLLSRCSAAWPQGPEWEAGGGHWTGMDTV